MLRWVGDFLTTYAADNTVRATLTLDDGLSSAEALAGEVNTGGVTVSGDLTAIPSSAAQALAGEVMTGGVTVTGDLTARPPTTDTPSLPTMVEQVEATLTAALLSWDEPADLFDEPIIRYEYSLDGGAWTDTTSTATVYLLTGLAPGTSYSLRVRAVTSNGNGDPSGAITIATIAATAPGAIRFLTPAAPGGTVIDLAFTSPLSDGGSPLTHYEVCVIDEDGTSTPFEPTDDAATTWRVRGLALHHRYGFRVRAVNAEGAGPPSPVVYAVPVPVTDAVTVPSGLAIPLLDEDRQSLIVRLADMDCRLTVYWSPSAFAWFADLEVPTNTLRVAGRRLALNAGLLGRTTGVLPGDIVLRELGDTGAEPARDAWARPTHALRYEA